MDSIIASSFKRAANYNGKGDEIDQPIKTAGRSERHVAMAIKSTCGRSSLTMRNGGSTICHVDSITRSMTDSRLTMTTSL